MDCPITTEKCSTNECIGYCSLIRTKLYKVIPSLKMCPECNQYLIPFGDVWLHQPDSKCRYAEMMGVTIEVTRDDYEKELGHPTTTFNDLMTHLLTEPKSMLKRVLNRFKQIINNLKQRIQSKNQSGKP